MSAQKQAIHQLTAAHAGGLSNRLRAHRLELFPPSADRTLRKFSSSEAAKLIGVNDGYLSCLVTRYEPGYGPQNQMVTFMRSMSGDHVPNYAMLKNLAISDTGMTKQTLYEVARDQFTRATYDRSLEALNNVNSEIAGLINAALGRAAAGRAASRRTA